MELRSIKIGYLILPTEKREREYSETQIDKNLGCEALITTTAAQKSQGYK